MPRNLTAAVINEIKSSGLRPVLFVQIYFTSGWSYVWTGYGTVVWNNQTWTGIGTFGTISEMPENTDVNAEGVQLQLSGIPSDMIVHALGEVVQGNPVIVYQGFLSSAGAIIANPVNAWAGRLDVCTISEGPDVSTVTVTAESRLKDLKRLRERRYTSDDQAIQFFGDKGFDYVPSLQQMNVTWGGASIPVQGPGSGGGGNDIPQGDGNDYIG